MKRDGLFLETKKMKRDALFRSLMKDMTRTPKNEEERKGKHGRDEYDAVPLYDEKPKISKTDLVKGQSSKYPTTKRDSYCNICMEHKYVHECFPIKNCSHSYCAQCVCKYVKAKIDNNVTSIGCPHPGGCEIGILDPESCQLILKPEVFDKWGRLLCEAMFVGSMRFYCPFKDCSALLIGQEEGSSDGSLVIRESECPHCHRLFCAQCKVPWHSGMSCEERKKDKETKEDSVMNKMAKKRKWQSCPKCGVYVSGSNGCEEMACRSRFSKRDAYCNICMEHKYVHECIPIKNCSHAYCTSCICQYVQAKIDNNATSIGCPDPGCQNGILDPESCKCILKPEVFDKWGRALCEAMFVGSMRFYCPFKDCSGLLIDEGEKRGGGSVIRESECPHCHRLFCAQCKVPWHSGMSCEERRKAAADGQSKEDLVLNEMAKKRKWQRCPKCGFYVSRITGCEEMACRCKYKFCYKCGASWDTSHYNCKGDKK